MESGRHYDECYGLAFAQNLKNKDIAEGGSKGVLLVRIPAKYAERQQMVLRKAVKAGVDGIIDLISQEESD
eukprot:UN25420